MDAGLPLGETKAPLRVTGYIDASFGCHDDGKNHSGLVVKVGTSTVLTMSANQKQVSKDSSDPEIVALSDMMIKAFECQEFIEHQGYGWHPPLIWQDNCWTVSLVTKGGGTYRTRLMKVCVACVKKRADDGDLVVSPYYAS